MNTTKSHKDDGKANLDASGAVVVALSGPRNLAMEEPKVRINPSRAATRDLRSQSQNTGSPRISCATILASELDLPETALRYPSYAAVLSEMLEASMACLTATKKLVRYHVYLQGLKLTFGESHKLVAGHPSSFKLIDLLS
jgi:hypothetical protein